MKTILSQEIIIFTEKITNRIEYIFDFIFHDFSGIDYKTTTDFEEFSQSILPKINFSNQFLENEINYKVDEILLEIDINKNINYYTLNEIGKCFYWLSRYEEYISPNYLFDEHNRFLGSDLDYSQPIVDLICIEIQKKICEKYPELIFKKRNFKQINTHDVDYAWKYLHHSKKIKNGNYELTESELKEYLKGYYTNEALEAGGVDNWEWYGEAMDDYLESSRDKKGEEYYIEDFVNDIINDLKEEL